MLGAPRPSATVCAQPGPSSKDARIRPVRDATGMPDALEVEAVEETLVARLNCARKD